MARVKCAICSSETDVSYNGVKYCSACHLWFCFDCAGPGKTQCSKCKLYSLK